MTTTDDLPEGWARARDAARRRDLALARWLLVAPRTLEELRARLGGVSRQRVHQILSRLPAVGYRAVRRREIAAGGPDARYLAERI